MSHPPAIAEQLAAKCRAAELGGSSIREHTRRLIAVAHRQFRDALLRTGRELCYLTD